MRQLIIFKNNNVELPEPYIDPSQTPLSFLSLQDGSTVSMSHYGTNASSTTPVLEYSRDGKNWSNWDFTSLTVNNGERIYFRGNNSLGIGRSNVNYSTFTGTGQFSVEGNIMSILYAEDYNERFNLPTTDCSLGKIFVENVSIIKADKLNLAATKVGYHCYFKMFAACTSLVTAPKILPATSLTGGDNCYESMFFNCRSLTTAPELPATSIASYCYCAMFKGCTSLEKGPEIKATSLYSSSFKEMFYNCTNLTYVKTYITSWNTTNTRDWLRNVAPNGTVECPSASTIPSDNVSGIPTGWTRVNF